MAKTNSPQADNKKAKLMEFAVLAVKAAPDRLRLAFNEKDETKAKEPEAAHFLKLDEVRLGKDMEQYSFMGDGPVGWNEALIMIMEDVYDPLREEFPGKEIEAAGEILRKLGESCYPQDLIGEWNAFFKKRN